jgi:aspartate aminotransferase-like enzyme
MKVPNIMTPGPTQVRDNVRLARSMKTTNPDLDERFFDFYKETCEKIGQFLKTKEEVRILCGEGILGLEAACASLTEPGDKVLVIDNGIFGEGFGDFVKIYGGEPVLFKGDRTKGIDIEELDKFIDKEGPFKYATLVHCDTPSGVLNDISKICPLLNRKNIMSVVDSVAGMGGEDVRVDEWKIDIVLGGSQKCISAPPGLTILSISEAAFKVMESRKTPIASFYCNLLLWKDYYKTQYFPYTMPISDIQGLGVAIDNILKEGTNNILKRHKVIAKATRKALVEAGLNLYLKGDWASTVTAFEVPTDIDDKVLRKYMKDKFNVIIAGSYGYLDGKVLRIGHMGENAYVDKISYTLMSLQQSLEHYGFSCKANLAEIFIKEI